MCFGGCEAVQRSDGDSDVGAIAGVRRPKRGGDFAESHERCLYGSSATLPVA